MLSEYRLFALFAPSALGRKPVPEKKTSGHPFRHPLDDVHDRMRRKWHFKLRVLVAPAKFSPAKLRGIPWPNVLWQTDIHSLCQWFLIDWVGLIYGRNHFCQEHCPRFFCRQSWNVGRLVVESTRFASVLRNGLESRPIHTEMRRLTPVSKLWRRM